MSGGTELQLPTVVTGLIGQALQPSFPQLPNSCFLDHFLN